MVEASAEHTFGNLEEFLDTLPTTPCPSLPMNRYYCTVCERVNKAIALHCQYSKLKDMSEEGKEGVATSIQFLPLSEESDKTGDEPRDKAGGNVEFKVVTTKKTDEDYPLFELVQAKDKKIEPIEMELLEEVAIEFEPSDEPVEVEVLEVAPLDESKDGLEIAEVVEVEAVEGEEGLEAIEVDVEEINAMPGESYPEFKPISTDTNVIEPTFIPKKPTRVPKKPHKKAIEKKPMKKPVSSAALPVKRQVIKTPKKVVVTPQAQPGHLAWQPPQGPVPQPGIQSSVKPGVQPITRPAVQPKQRIQPMQPYQMQPPMKAVGRRPVVKKTLSPIKKAPRKVPVTKKGPKKVPRKVPGKKQ